MNKRHTDIINHIFFKITSSQTFISHHQDIGSLVTVAAAAGTRSRSLVTIATAAVSSSCTAEGNENALLLLPNYFSFILNHFKSPHFGLSNTDFSTSKTSKKINFKIHSSFKSFYPKISDFCSTHTHKLKSIPNRFFHSNETSKLI